jgi:chromosome segregation ATPase
MDAGCVATASRKASTFVPTPSEVPVTNAMLGKVRAEILQRVDQAREEGRADNQRLDAKIQRLDAKIDDVKAELKADIRKLDTKADDVKAELKADLQEVKADLHEVKAAVHGMEANILRIQALMEEQNARNKVVLDGLAAVLNRHGLLEERVTRVEDTVRSLAAAPAARKPE